MQCWYLLLQQMRSFASLSFAWKVPAFPLQQMYCLLVLTVLFRATLIATRHQDMDSEKFLKLSGAHIVQYFTTPSVEKEDSVIQVNVKALERLIMLFPCPCGSCKPPIKSKVRYTLYGRPMMHVSINNARF